MPNRSAEHTASILDAIRAVRDEMGGAYGWQARAAERLGLRPDQVSRLLSGRGISKRTGVRVLKSAENPRITMRQDDLVRLITAAVLAAVAEVRAQDRAAAQEQH